MRDGDPRNSNPRLPLAPIFPVAPTAIHSIGVFAGVRSSSLLLGQGGDEFAAEVGDVWDHAVSDQMGDDSEMAGDVFEGRPGRFRGSSSFP